MRVGQGRPGFFLPDHPDAHVGGVDAHGVVGLIADIEMGFELSTISCCWTLDSPPCKHRDIVGALAGRRRQMIP